MERGRRLLVKRGLDEDDLPAQSSSTDRGSTSTSSGTSVSADEVEASMQTLAMPSLPSSSDSREIVAGTISSLPQASISAETVGNKGTVIAMKVNYYDVKPAPGWALYVYYVTINPYVDEFLKWKEVIRTAAAQMGLVYYLDGKYLYSPQLLGNVAKEDLKVVDAKDLFPRSGLHDYFMRKPAIRVSWGSDGNDYFKISLRLAGKLITTDRIYFSVYEQLIRDSMLDLNLKDIEGTYFDLLAATSHPNQRITFWQGYKTSIQCHEKKLLLCVDTPCKILHADNLLRIIRALECTHGDDVTSFQIAVRSELIHKIVFATYNKKSYRVLDVEFQETPKTLYWYPSGEMSIADYHKKNYQITTQDLNQPLLYVTPLVEEWAWEWTEYNYMVPEHCQMVGLTNEMKANAALMKEVDNYSQLGPKEKQFLLNSFVNRLLNDEMNTIRLNDWGVQFGRELIELMGRSLPKEIIRFRNGSHQVDDKGDFSAAFSSNQMFYAADLSSWSIIVPPEAAEGVEHLLEVMSNVACSLGMNLAEPKQVFKMEDSQPDTYLNALDEVVKGQNLRMVFVILPYNNEHLQHVVNISLTVDHGVPGQCFFAKDVFSEDLTSLMTKVMVQMNAKLGGEPWTLKLDLQSTMVVGVDVCGNIGGVQTAAMVATFSSNCSRYFSTTTYFRKKSQLNEFKIIPHLILECCRNYLEVNEQLPRNIILYRDSGRTGRQLDVQQLKLQTLLDELEMFYSSVGQDAPDLTYIVANQNIDTRLMLKETIQKSPSAGTVVDSVITFPNCYDFYLVSNAPDQANVKPCYYRVLEGGKAFDADELQLITYKLCHLDYNSFSAVPVPAPCQYARKLALFSKLFGDDRGDNRLSRLLYFI